MKVAKILLLAVLSGFFNARDTTIAQSLAFTSGTYAVNSNNPVSIAVADVNGDGKSDLVCGYQNGNTITVLTNNGSGVFGSNATYTVGSHPYSVAAADVNGDGKVDLISANFGANSLTVLTNNGSGKFVINTTISNVGTSPDYIVAADVNGDGKVDLVCANAGDTIHNSTLTVLTNNGSGGFAISATPTVGVLPDALVATDVNGDGKVDLVCANLFDYTLTVLTNNGSGVFGFNATLNVANLPRSVAAADVNGDGRMDLIFGTQSGNVITVLTNNGSGVFGSNATYVVGTDPYSVTAADLNGDGKVDLICGNFGNGNPPSGNTLTVLTNNGSGTFATASTPVVGYGPIYVTTADVNGDGKPDLVCANWSDNTLTVLINTTVFLPPTLNIKPTANKNFILLWPTNAAGFVLQQNFDLSTTNWANVTNTPTVTNGQNQLILSPTNGSDFYRLKTP